MSIQSIAFSAIRFPVISAICLTFILSGCLESPETFIDREVTQTSNQGAAADDPHANHGTDTDTDTGTGTGTSNQPNTTVPAGADYVSGFWGTTETLGAAQYPASSSPTVQSQQLQIADDKNVFFSWSTKTTIDAAVKEDFNFLRGVFDATSTYSWSALDAYAPAGITDSATEIQLAINHTNKDAYALWNDGSELKVSTFMGSMDHFMGTASIAEGHVAQMLVNASSDAYLVTQSHMAGGFGISVHKRSDTSSWTAAVQLHRMDTANEIQMPNHFMKAVVDGNNNIFVVWLELHNGLSRLMAAIYDTATDTWGTPTSVVDSTNTHGLDLLNLKSISAAGKPSSSDIYLAMFQDTGTEKAIFTLDFSQGSWQMPMRRDDQTATQTINSSDVSYADNGLGHGVVAWVEKDSTTDASEIKMLRLTPTEGWGATSKVTDTLPSTSVDALSMAMNSQGAALAVWFELDTSSSVRLLSVTQELGKVWPKKEIVATFSNGRPFSPVIAIHENGIPWISWLSSSTSASNDIITAQLIKRTVAVDSAEPMNNGDTTTTPDGSDNTTGGSDNTTGGTDNTTSTWHSSVKVGTNIMPISNQVKVDDLAIHRTIGGLFVNWETKSNPDVNGVYAQQDFTLLRGLVDSTTNMYIWSDQNNGNFSPVDYANTATNTQFNAVPGNSSTNNGLVIWNDNNTTMTSEFMGNMSHFMNKAELPNGHSPQVLTSSTGEVYLLMETEMNGGFGLSVFKRTGADQWSTADVMHRMDTTNPISMPNHFLIATMDGLDNIRAVWLENHDGNTALHTATYAIAADGAGSWDAPSDIETNGMLILDQLVSGTVTMSANGKELNVILHQENNSEHSVYSVIYSATSGWAMPIRLDMADTAIQMVSEPQIAHNQQGDVIVAWIETNTAMVASNSSSLMNMLVARQYFIGSGWEVAKDIVHAPMTADISTFGIALTALGDAAASWVELDSTNNKLKASFHSIDDTAWSASELVQDISIADGVVNSLVMEIDNSAMANLLWAVEKTDAVNDTIDFWQVTRMTTIGDSGTGNGGTDTGGTDTGGTDTGGTDTGGTDTGAGSNTPIVTGLWNAITSVQITEMAIGRQSNISSPNLQINSDGDVFANWKVISDPDENMNFAEQNINVVRGDLDAAGNFSWSSPDNTMFNPISYDSTSARNANLFASNKNANAIAVWNNNGVTVTSEFMNDMGHFMNKADLTNGFNPQILFASNGDVFLLMETEMGGGFGLSVFRRTAADQWSAAIMLHRMDMTNAYNIMNHNLMAGLDSQNNIHVMWVEGRADNSAQTLQTAKYTSTSDTWGLVSEIAASNMVLNKIVSGTLSDVTNEEMNVVLHQQDGTNHQTFSIKYDVTNGWDTPVRIDSVMTGTSQVTAPTVAHNADGHLMVAWVETMTGMTASNTSGLMNIIAVKRYMPGMGWHADIEHVAHAAMDADAAGVEVTLNSIGEASVIWKEATSSLATINASHKISGSSAWSQKEVIHTLQNSDGMVMDMALSLDNSNDAHIIWSEKQTGLVNDSLKISQTKRLTSIDDATVGSGGMPGNGTGSGSGNTGGNTPANANWTLPVNAIQSMQNGSVNLEVGKEPQIVMDSFGNTTVKFAMTTSVTNNGSTVSTTDNKIAHSADGINWQDLLANATILDDLSASARIESIHAVPLTGNLYGLIRDTNKLYLARYVDNTGWSKIEIPEVPVNIEPESLQIASNETGMITIVWIEPVADSFDVSINAKHFMVATGWDETQSITVAFEKILAPHYIDSDGNVYATWLVSNSNSSSGLFDVKMASYTPMQGWSSVTNGPEGIRNVYPNTVSGGHHKVIVDADDLDSHTIDAYAIRHDGAWSRFPNINHKLADDQIVLANRDDVQVVMGDSGQFVVAWSEAAVDDQGNSVLRYMSVTAHMMTDPDTGMEMIHWTTPTEIGGMNSDMESSLQFAITASGDVYAVWIGGLNKVYVNHADSEGVWDSMPDMLAEYDLANDVVALNPRVVIGGQGKVSITWDEYSKTSAMTMHKIWVVQNQ